MKKSNIAHFVEHFIKGLTLMLVAFGFYFAPSVLFELSIEIPNVFFALATVSIGFFGGLGLYELTRANPKRDLCPQCFQTLVWTQLWNFSNMYGKRQIRPCPFCKTSLIRKKWSWYFLSLGCYSLVTVMLCFFLFDFLFEEALRISPFFWVSMLTLYFSLFFLGFEIVKGSKRSSISSVHVEAS